MVESFVNAIGLALSAVGVVAYYMVTKDITNSFKHFINVGLAFNMGYHLARSFIKT